MRAQPREQERFREMSLGHDPDLIARYLAGEDVAEQLREVEGPERVLRLLSDEVRSPLRRSEKPRNPPTIALIAVVIALAIFAASVWIAFKKPPSGSIAPELRQLLEKL